MGVNIYREFIKSEVEYHRDNKLEEGASSLSANDIKAIVSDLENNDSLSQSITEYVSEAVSRHLRKSR